jgi:integration host factor subunit alpha
MTLNTVTRPVPKTVEKTVTRADLVQTITEKFMVSKPVAVELLESVLELLSEALAKGEKVKILNFGTFSVHQKPERIGRNPRTRIEAKITARRAVKFKAAAVLKDKVEKDPSKQAQKQIPKEAA